MLNKVMLIGNLGQDPELRYTASGQAVCDMRIATSETYTDREGQRQERTEWHRVVVWARQAENCKRYLSKGRQVYVEGRLQTREWEDKSGNRRFTTEIVAQNVRFLKGGGPGGGYNSPPPPTDADAPAFVGGSSRGSDGGTWNKPAGDQPAHLDEEDLPF